MAALLAQALEKAVETENTRGSGGRVAGRGVAGRIKKSARGPAGSWPTTRRYSKRCGPSRRTWESAAGWIVPRPTANIPLSLGLQAVSIGAGGQGGGAHTAAEWYQPEGRDLGLRRVLLALCLLLDKGMPTNG